LFPKCESHTQSGTVQTDPLYILHRTLKPLESLLTCLKMNWLAILVSLYCHINIVILNLCCIKIRAEHRGATLKLNEKYCRNR
jgi:hypothetical protein